MPSITAPVRDRILIIIKNIYHSHPAIKNDRQLAKELSKVYKTSNTVISKWRNGMHLPLLEHVIAFNKLFKKYGATAEYLIEGKGAEVKQNDLEKRVSKIEKKLKNLI